MPGWNGLNILYALEVQEQLLRCAQQVGRSLSGAIAARMDLRCYGHRTRDTPLSGQYGPG